MCIVELGTWFCQFLGIHSKNFVNILVYVYNLLEMLFSLFRRHCLLVSCYSHNRPIETCIFEATYVDLSWSSLVEFIAFFVCSCIEYAIWTMNDWSICGLLQTRIHNIAYVILTQVELWFGLFSICFVTQMSSGGESNTRNILLIGTCIFIPLSLWCEYILLLMCLRQDQVTLLQCLGNWI